MPLFGNPATDTVLLPDRNYKLRAIVSNDSPTPAVNTVVRFWQSHGGLSADGNFLDVETITIPGHSSREIASKLDFHSGDLNTMTCAAVTVYNAQSDLCNVDYPTYNDAAATLSPSWLRTGQPWNAAWRNTHSRLVFIGDPFEIHLAAAYPRIPLPLPLRPVELNVESILIPRDWQTIPEMADALLMLQAAGAQARCPAYLLPRLRDKFKKVDLDIEVKAEVRVETLQLVPAAAQPATATVIAAPAGPIRRFNLHAPAERPVPLTVTGKLPHDARDGDTFLVTCSATYPKADGTPAALVSFTEALYVMQR